jgi:endonuclease YncB( thermonuclease family)
VNDTFAFLLLISALVLFFYSTRQLQLAVRGAIWGGGMVLLALAWMILGGKKRDPELGRAFGDFFSKLTHPGDSLLLQMLDRNWPTVGRIIFSLFDIFAILAVLVAIAALAAFTPGEKTERAIRPIMIGVIGAIVGGLLALTLVGTGFGEGEKRKGYAAPMSDNIIVNAETISLNNDVLKLRGIDAYEADQSCRFNNAADPCGAESKRALTRMLEGTFVMCALQDDTVAKGKAPAPSDRQATCTAVRKDGVQFNIAQRMVEEGYAFSVGGAFEKEAIEAKASRRGMTTRCGIQPASWVRMSSAQRVAFKDKGVVPEKVLTVGAECPKTAPVKQQPKKPKTSEAIARPQ